MAIYQRVKSLSRNGGAGRNEGVIEVNPSTVKDMVFESGYEHLCIGNTWRVTEDGDWYLPEKTLGWELIEFASRWYLDQRGNPFVLTDEQLRLCLWLYALNDDGLFQSDFQIIQRLKG